MNSSKISDDFPNSGKIYLNNASVSLMPQISIDAMKEFLITYNSLGPDSIDSDSFVIEKLRNVRKIISKIINCQPEEIVLTQSTTDGINIVANGLSFDPDSNIIIRGLLHEHHANLYPWLRLTNRLKVSNLPIDKNGFFDLKKLYNLVNTKTKLVALSHALYNTGAILPVEQVGQFLAEKQIPYFLDCAQTIGCIGNFDVKKTRCDFIAFNGSKWLCGPMGTGIFYCNAKSSPLLEPAEIGGESAMMYDDIKLAPKELPDKFQTGFRNYVGMVGLETSANYIYKFGLEKIRQLDIKLADILREELSQIKHIEFFGPEESKVRTSIVSFRIQNIKPQTIVERLEKIGIVLAVREIIDTKIIRASPHFFNTEEEMCHVADSIKKL